jgi:hypothetical protein
MFVVQILLWSTLCHKLYYETKNVPLILHLEELKNLMQHVFELNFISFFVHQNGVEEMFFLEQENVIGFLIQRPC